MREKLIASLRTAGASGPPLSIRYYLLEETGRTETLYGIKIVEETTQAAAIAPGLTQNKQHAFKLIVRLARERVTPAGLAQVLADLL